MYPAPGLTPPLQQQPVSENADGPLINYKHVDWASFPRHGSLRKQMRWCRKTLAADRFLWVFPYFYHNQPMKCVVDGTDCEDPEIFKHYPDEAKELLTTWWMKSDMDGGRSMMGTYCPECAKVLLTALTIRKMISDQRKRATQSLWSKLSEKFQRKRHQYWGAIQAAVSEKKDERAWEEVYAPIIEQFKKDKLPVYHVDTNETIIIIKKDVLEEKYGKKEEKAEEDDENKVTEKVQEVK